MVSLWTVLEFFVCFHAKPPTNSYGQIGTGLMFNLSSVSMWYKPRPCTLRHFKASDLSIQIFFIYIYLGFTARQDYFTHFEPSQS